MKNTKTKKKTIITIVIVLLLALVIGFFTYKTLHNESKLSVEEKEWLTENINNVQNLYVLNNVDVYGKNGTGVFYDFLNDLSKKNNININKITFNDGEEVPTKSFKVVYNLEEDDVLFGKEHYVVISKTKQNYSSLSQLTNKKIGIITQDEKILTKYLNDVSRSIITVYESSTNLFTALDEEIDIELAIVPLEENLTTILTSNYYIDYHISDLNKYFIFDPEENDTLSSIITKYYNSWNEDNFMESYNKNELNTFISALSISDKDLDSIQSNVYKYGFVNTSPYEVLTGGKYGGIVSEYIARFKAFSGIEFTSTRYKNFNKFTEAIANDKIDIFFNYYNLDTNYQKIDSIMNISFVIVAPKENNIVLNSVSSLNDKTVYVLKNSILEKYLTSLGGIQVKTYTDEKSLKKISKKDNLIFMDKEVFNYYHETFLKNYNIRYTNTLSETYNFYTKDNTTFNLLFTKYIQTLDPEEIRITGIYNHYLTINSGTVMGKVAKYVLLVIVIFSISLFIAYRSTKKVKITKRIKKEDKMKYIDQLTSLKNRNYLNENKANWNKNTIYPQATIMIDLNSIHKINDTLGYEQGDAQIKAAANILIKTQLDNTDIMRTDGNEYLIYMVGYQEKQVVSYIRKLYKEFKNLPYEHGAAIGYSMITNDVKTIDDSINEAADDMRSKKEETEEE